MNERVAKAADRPSSPTRWDAPSHSGSNSTTRRSPLGRFLLRVALPAASLVMVLAASHFSQKEPVQNPWTAPITPVVIELSPAALNSLRDTPRDDVPAVVRMGGQALSHAQVRLKGSGSFRAVDDLPSLTVSWETPEGRRRLHLENSVEDPSRLHAFLGAALFREAGLPVPQARHAQVSLNRRALGLYVLRPGYDSAFTGEAFGNGACVILEPAKGADAGGSFRASGGASRESQAVALAAVNRLAGDGADPDLGRRWKALSEHLDVRRFATLLAGEALLGHWDGYGVARNNYRILWDPAAGRCVFLPHGMDQLFPDSAYPIRPVFSSRMARAFLETVPGQELYQAEWRRLASTWMDAEALAGRVQTQLARITPLLTFRQRGSLRQESQDLIRRIRKRCEAVAGRQSEPHPVLFFGRPGHEPVASNRGDPRRDRISTSVPSAIGRAICG